MTDFLIYTVTIVSVWAVLAISLNLQFGITGLVNFGQVLPFAVGAYSAAFVEIQGLPYTVGIVAALAVTPLIGCAVVFPARRLSQDYWALITLGAGEIFRLTMLNYPTIAGGAEGVSVDRLGDRTLAMILALVLLGLTWALAELISRSPLGRFLRVIREDEVLASSLGRNTFRYQVVATVIGSAIAGLAGVLYAHVIGFVHPSGFMVIETFILWTAMILGGPGCNLGVVIGALVIQLTSVLTRFVAQWTGLPSDLVANLRLALIGLVLVIMIIYRPQGLLPERKRTYNAPSR